MAETIRVGVVGVGTMGRHHARVYNELPAVELVGVTDENDERAQEVATRFDTRVHSLDRLCLIADAVSIAVPTRSHASVASDALRAGTDVLVEKPFVNDLAAGRELLELADREDQLVGVGHVERYNPAVLALDDVLAETDPFAVAARRQGPPVDRDSNDSVVADLMIHDLDIVCSIADGRVADVSVVRVPAKEHVVAQLTFASGQIATLTASRDTQKRIRDLAIAAGDCQIDVDYVDQSVQIHRHSMPEYVETNGDIRYRHESIIERPTVETGEPLKNELESFVGSVRDRSTPHTSGHDGLRAVELVQRIERAIDTPAEAVHETQNT